MYTEADRTHLNPNVLTKEFKALREEPGLPPVRLRDLRHIHASIMPQGGVHLKVVQERLGHASIAITGPQRRLSERLAHTDRVALPPTVGALPRTLCNDSRAQIPIYTDLRAISP